MQGLIHKIVLVIIVTSIYSRSYAQFFIQKYEMSITDANHFMRRGLIDSAAYSFDEALDAMDGKFAFAVYYLEAAKCWARIGNTEKAFSYLENFVEKGWVDIEKVQTDSSFHHLHEEVRWDRFMTAALTKNEKYNEAQALLTRIGFEDQVLRRIRKCIGTDSLELDYFDALSARQDDENLHKVDSLVAIYGWLGMNKIGKKANGILWRVIHHATPDVRKRYFPIIEASVRRGETSPTNFALLVDRVLIDKGEKQLYGSQYVTIDGVNKVVTCSEPETINARRASWGLSTIETYLALCGIHEVSVESLSDISTLEYLLASRKGKK